MRMLRGNDKGFTLIELLVVVGIVGVLAALAIVNYMVALDKSKQKRTMADMRSVASAWEARATDRGGYAAAGAVFVWPSEDVPHTQMLALLHPTYIHPLVKFDGWGGPFEFAIEPSAGGATTYAIRSAGKDGLFETSYEAAQTDRFECDLVFSNGAFVVSPFYK